MPLKPLSAKSAAAKAWNRFNGASFTIGTEATNTINVAVRLKDAKGLNVVGPCHVRAYLSDNADGSTLTATATTSALAVGTNGVLVAVAVTGKVADLITDASGRFDLNLIQTATPTYYLVVQLPDGSLAVSAAITFA